MKIREIIGMLPITSVPETPAFVKGVINLRGKVIPVVDLRLRFGIAEIDYTERTCIIVVEIAGPAGTVSMGVVVDSVSEVLNIKGADIEDTPFGRLTKRCPRPKKRPKPGSNSERPGTPGAMKTASWSK